MLLCTSTYYKEYNVLQSTILYYKGLQSTGAFCSAQLCKCNETVRHSRLIVLTHDTSSTLRGASYGMQNTLAVARRSLGVFCIRGFHCALEWTSQGFCCYGFSLVHSSSAISPHHTTASPHITWPHNQPYRTSTSHHNRTTSRVIPWYHITLLHIKSHHMTAHVNTSHHIQHITWHDMTSRQQLH